MNRLVGTIHVETIDRLNAKAVNLVGVHMQLKTKKSNPFSGLLFGGMDGTRTRDPLRDRQVF